MIPVARAPLSQASLDELKRLTDKGQGWDGFRTPPRRSKASKVAASSEVLNVLERMFHNKCAFCEHNVARTIDHFCPKEKKLYPSRRFVWENLLLSCSDCNTLKQTEDPFNPAAHGGGARLLDPTVDVIEDHLRWDWLTGRCDTATSTFRGTETARVCHLELQGRCEDRRLIARDFAMKILDLRAPTAREADKVDLLLQLLAPERPALGIIRQLLIAPPTPEFVDTLKATEARWPQLKARFDELRAAPSRSQPHAP